MALLLTIAAVALLFRYGPRRRQPSLRWLLPGILLSTSLWVAVTALLGLYTTTGSSFSEIYGPLTGVVALLLWANASGVAFFFGVACSAQVEAVRNGEPAPCEPDRWASP
ncbi:YihY/virulence factor BrkB family protein [Pseudosporangium ferrugineum]|uniref:Virulence factor BrkB n=1 Tax=Pseudosporangium ferrugineum TaxID=439699 RepID=A0A2T0RGB1_9ACTN|nr:virulence factor BrkB [Pseudosporangium ferrugineum]